MLDSNGRVIEDGPEPRPILPGDTRTYRVWLDSNQYRIDMDNASHGGEDVYEGFNIIMRRKPKENNFKAVLETIRELMNTECVVPDWLHDIILGYGDPGAARYARYILNTTNCLIRYCNVLFLFPLVECQMKSQQWILMTRFSIWIIYAPAFLSMKLKFLQRMKRNWCGLSV